MKDFFELPEKWSPALAAILERYEEMDNDYKTCEALLKEVESVGYTFEYGLDAEPYNLKPMNMTREEYEDIKDFCHVKESRLHGETFAIETDVLFDFLRGKINEEISFKPFTRGDVLTYLNLLQSYSPQMLGGMELGAMRDQTAEHYTGSEVFQLGEMGKHSIVTVREDLLEAFCDAVNALYEQCDNEDDKFLSMARVYNHARQFADGGHIY